MSGDIESGESKKKKTASYTRKSVDDASQVESLLFDNHGKDSRYNGPVKKSQTLCANFGTGGNNQPFVIEKDVWPKLYDVRSSSLNTKNVRHSIYETTTCRTVDTSGNRPDSNQGGVAIVNQKHKGKRMFVRRITPKECGRLQGFPDDWCEGLVLENPSAEDLLFWKKVFDSYNQSHGKAKREKTLKQIRKWLGTPHSDSAEYKMWGNGVALPCVEFIFENLSAYLNKA